MNPVLFIILENGARKEKEEEESYDAEYEHFKGSLDLDRGCKFVTLLIAATVLLISALPFLIDYFTW